MRSLHHHHSTAYITHASTHTRTQTRTESDSTYFSYHHGIFCVYCCRHHRRYDYVHHRRRDHLELLPEAQGSQTQYSTQREPSRIGMLSTTSCRMECLTQCLRSLIYTSFFIEWNMSSLAYVYYLAFLGNALCMGECVSRIGP